MKHNTTRLYQSNNVSTASRSISHERNHQSIVQWCYQTNSYLAGSGTYPGPRGIQASPILRAGDNSSLLTSTLRGLASNLQLSCRWHIQRPYPNILCVITRSELLLSLGLWRTDTLICHWEDLKSLRLHLGGQRSKPIFDSRLSRSRLHPLW
jgi:hypothetical protein